MPSIVGISSRIGTVALGIQTAKGTPAANPTVKAFYNAAPSVKPYQNDARFSMTDSNRDAGDPYVTQIGVAGDVPVYCHAEMMALLWHLTLGANADTGSSDPYTHTATPANDQPYFTMWRMVGNTIFEKYTDCKINQLTIDGGAGSPLTATFNVMGITSTFLASDVTTVDPITTSPYLYMDGAGALKVDTVAYPIHALNLVVNNNLSAFQADGYGIDNVDPGGRDITGSYSIRFGGATALPLDYRSYFYGSDAGTAQSTTFATHALDFLFTRAVGPPARSMEIQIPKARWADIPVQPDPGGAVIEVQCAFEAMRSGFTSHIEGPIMTAITLDGNATA